MENEYDSYDDGGDFDSDFDLGGEVESDGGVPDTAEGEIDAIAALISGDSEKADALVSQREKTGGGSKTSRQSINLDANGHKVWHSSAPEPEPEAPEEPETIYPSEVQQAGQHAVSEWQAAHDENERLNDLFSSGQLSAQDHYRLTMEQGQRAAQAKEMMYQTRIAELQHGAQRDDVHRRLEAELGSDVWGPETRMQTMKDLVEFGRSQGLGDDLLASVENEKEAAAIYRAMKNEKELETTKLELKAAKAMLKKQHAELKGRRVKQSKDASIGKRNADAVDQVAALLAEHGVDGGRR
jgi:hypothetical protein